MAMIEGHTSCASLLAMALLKSLFFAADGRVRAKSVKRCICMYDSRPVLPFFLLRGHKSDRLLGIPITAIVTGANVHDSQVAIPMEKLTERKVSFLYSVMDSAYDAAPVAACITGKGRVPLNVRLKQTRWNSR